jgi:hypothetical protein
MTDLTKDQLDTALASWQTINKAISSFTEVDCKNALQREMVGNRREDIAIRIHQRYNKLRSERERREISVALMDKPSFLV